MDDVKSDCEMFLMRFLSPSNCLPIRSFAIQHNCPKLTQSADRFALSNFHDLRRTPDFLTISCHHLTELIADSNLNVASEADVFEAVVAWVQHDTHNRSKMLPLLLSHVRLTQLPLPYLVEFVCRNPLIKGDPYCSELVNQTFVRVLVQSRLLKPSSSSVSIDEEVCRPRKSAAGVLFCVGGRGSNGDPFRSAEVYDCLNNVWFAVSEMNTKRRHVGVVSANGKIFAIGGHNGTEHLNSVEMFDPRLNLWVEKTPMKFKRRGIALGFLEGAIYSVGGLDDTACFLTVERYDVEYDLWTSVASMNMQRGGVGVAALGKFLYAVGGNDGTSSLKSCERYDPYLNRWKQVAEMNFRRAGAGVAVLNGFM
ncbi:unnamed protein product [Soboliphyme baturini]|uniref:BACK domain-containing protein n=1 Tax=Soboliphyme baturini TaxID=241478 RepID=A0A183J693_9BILA|nr:unnamed protein product [Soboliphyme baturini]